MPYEPINNLQNMTLSQIADLMSAHKLPPLNQWQPEKMGESEMVILSNGNWLHQGSPIKRPAMVRAFSRLLYCDENGDYWLKTPYEKLSIKVEDAPLIAVELIKKGHDEQQHLIFRLNNDEIITANQQHPIILKSKNTETGNPETGNPETGEEIFHINLPHGLCAKASRAVHFELAEMAMANENGDFGLWSQNNFFAIVIKE